MPITKITVIMPVFCGEAYLQETFASIRIQQDPQLEVLVCDGGSTDRTMQIVRENADIVTWWCSEPDRGQSHAINKGLARMTGDIWCYFNGDDLFRPGAFARVRSEFTDSDLQWLSGRAAIFDTQGERGRIDPTPPRSRLDYLTPWNRRDRPLFPFSGSCFLRRNVVELWGSFDESFHYSMDMEFYTRLALRGAVTQRLIPDILANWRWHENTKTATAGSRHGFLREEIRIAERFAEHLPLSEQATLEHELHTQRNWLALRDAASSPRGPGRLAPLLKAVGQQPRLLGFRPWWGALRAALRPTSHG